MTQIESSKLIVHVATGSEEDSIAVSKLIVYLIVAPGSEPEAPVPTLQTAFTYAQIPRVLTYTAGETVFGKILLSGDMQSGTDALSLSGDQQSGTDDEQYSYGV